MDWLPLLDFDGICANRLIHMSEGNIWIEALGLLYVFRKGQATMMIIRQYNFANDTDAKRAQIYDNENQQRTIFLFSSFFLFFFMFFSNFFVFRGIFLFLFSYLIYS